MGSRMRDYLIEQARQAEELGHRMRVEHRPMREEWVSDSGRRDKYWAVCSCGYTSARRNTHGLALGACFAHIGDVVGEAQAAASSVNGGVSLPGSVRPAL